MSGLRFGLAAGAVVLLALGLSGAASAADKLEGIVLDEGTSMTLSPTKAQLTLEPGIRSNDSFYIYNTGKDDFTFAVEAKPYYVKDEDYQPYFDSSIESSRTMMAGWITLEYERYFLPSGEGVEVRYTIDVPDDVPEIGQYAAILVNTVPDEDAESVGGVVTIKQLGYLIHARMEGGETRLEADLVTHEIPFMHLSGPLGDIVRIENTGNVELVAKRRNVITNFFTGEVVYDTDEAEIYVLPDTSRALLPGWSGAPMLGLFRVESTVWINDRVYVLTGLSLVVPLFLVVVLGLAVVLAIVYLAVRHRRRKGSPEKVVVDKTAAQG